MTISLRERRRLMLRDEILQAARLLILEKGYAAMSMDDLAAHVGISKPTLYSYFAAKEDLVVAAFISEVEKLFAFVEAETEQLSPRQRLMFLLKAMMKQHADEATMAARPATPELFQILCAHEQSFKYMQRVEALIASLFEEAIASGEVDASLNPKAMVRAFFSNVHAARISQFFPIDVDTEVLEKTLTAFFERGIIAQ